ncbi:Phosphate-selective porin O and P [Pseudoalteromonas phenolica]|uniref:Phosphate-selective porin O and P n=2 Tax=Pseudoalteromonas phenolica TaxID=161398 RepID=A0A0S2K837_9GAMM|nr:Phosphate-selective porin O and P [Pseudoalteromonas phenolica]
MTATAIATLLASTAQAQESKLDSLSVSGFIDMSYYSVEQDKGASVHEFGLDQVELNLAYQFDSKLSANVDIEYQNSDEGVDLEQAFLNYSLSENLTVKAGRFLSYSGWETEEPTGLFQYSGTGYAQYFYGYYQQGVSAIYSSEKFAVAVSVVNDLAGPQSTDSEHPGVETMVAFTPNDAVTVKGFYSKDGDVELINTWASYSAEKLTVAAEYNQAENSAFSGSDASGYLVMANYAFDDFGFTVRYHDFSVEDELGTVVTEQSSLTLSPSYAVNDNLLMVFEYRMDDNVTTADEDIFAIEALLTF